MWNHHACVLSFHCCHLHHSHFCRNLCFTYKKSPLVVSVFVILTKTPNLHYHNDNLFLQKATFTFVNCRGRNNTAQDHSPRTNGCCTADTGIMPYEPVRRCLCAETTKPCTASVQDQSLQHSTSQQQSSSVIIRQQQQLTTTYSLTSRQYIAKIWCPVSNEYATSDCKNMHASNFDYRLQNMEVRYKINFFLILLVGQQKGRLACK